MNSPTGSGIFKARRKRTTVQVLSTKEELEAFSAGIMLFLNVLDPRENSKENIIKNTIMTFMVLIPHPIYFFSSLCSSLNSIVILGTLSFRALNM